MRVGSVVRSEVMRDKTRGEERGAGGTVGGGDARRRAVVARPKLEADREKAEARAKAEGREELELATAAGQKRHELERQLHARKGGASDDEIRSSCLVVRAIVSRRRASSPRVLLSSFVETWRMETSTTRPTNASHRCRPAELGWITRRYHGSLKHGSRE